MLAGNEGDKEGKFRRGMTWGVALGRRKEEEEEEEEEKTV